MIRHNFADNDSLNKILIININIELSNIHVTSVMFPLYLILIGDLFVGEVGDGHLVVGQLPDFMLGSLAGFPSVEKVSQGLVVNFNKARCEGELIKQNK